MKIKIFKPAALLSLVLLFFACSKENDSTLNQELQEKTLFTSENTNFVSMTKANDVAAVFFDQLMNDQLTKSNARLASTETIRDRKNNEPLMYVVNFDSGGFVIVSATKKYFPILAYSDENNFVFADDMPLGIIIWLDEAKAAINYQINEAADVDTKAYFAAWKQYEEANIGLNRMQTKTPGMYDFVMPEVNYWYGQGYSIAVPGYGGPQEICDQWAIYAEGSVYPLYDYLQCALVVSKYIESATYKGPLLSTQRYQTSPFNYLCNSHPTGCVPVAMGQIMKYYAYPSGFNWSNMPDTDELTSQTLSSTPALLRNIGDALGLDYVNGDVNATIDEAKTAFQSSYYYTVTKSAHNYTDVRNYINSNKPVYMRGAETSGGSGHAWVCDGYNSYTWNTQYYLRVPTSFEQYSTIQSHQADQGVLDMYHMNWGWGGLNDGWFSASSIAIPGDSNYQYDRFNLYVTY